MRSQLLLLLTKIGLTAFWGLVVVLVLFGSVPESPFPWTPEERLTLTALAPEGWAFFTRNPREPVQELYRRRNGEWVPYERANFSVHNWLGMKRLSTIENVELQHLLRKAGPDSTWTQCSDDLQACRRTHELYTVQVKNTTATRRFCDSLLVRKHKPVPWAWSDAASPVVMPSSVVQLNISCPPADR